MQKVSTGNVVVASLAFLAAATFMVGTAFAASTNGNKLQCFDGTTDGGYGGICTVMGGTATLNNTDGNVNGSYSGVYLSNSNLDGKLIGNIGLLGFSYTGVATAGAPRLTFPLDKNNDGVTDVYVSVGAYYCNDGAGKVDVINDPTCTIYLNDNSAGPWANWAALVAENPTWKVTAGELPFIIADEAGSWTVSNVMLGKGPAKAGK